MKFPPNTDSGYTLAHYRDVLTNPLNWKIAWTTLWIGTTAMAIMLGIAIPLAYYMVFKAGRWELFLLLSLVLADELAPVVKVYAWQVILGRNGILNWLIPGPPDVVVAVQLVRGDRDARRHLHHVHDDPDLRRDEGDRRRRCSSRRSTSAPGWWVQSRRILIPLAAPGIFIAMILVYIPMLTDFVTADIVGGTGSYMMGQRVRDLILGSGDWGRAPR